ncbi:hypothetical protein [Gordonibacter massiliensis (ex Traore et al. 2017)]|uniref:hypothetical protein n=1 Tax=Gordonibacter massiliensis (ex Traore et al. 2017) TaxID=1841863 RepID=UPI001C8C9DFE|nr:hypothetical protein [Gordonibacter massiliensis (ex Traore et al. 2017)]MBX9035054.1 hypothetical protein [Gordonibacter massiliensis (ex Traore et al. 2017)]
MIEIRLWKPCLNCPHADVTVDVEDVRMCGHSETAYTSSVVSCSHAPVCARVDGAKPLIGGAE